MTVNTVNTFKYINNELQLGIFTFYFFNDKMDKNLRTDTENGTQ